MKASAVALALAVTCGMATCGTAAAQGKGGPTESTPGAAVYFVELKDGATVPTRVIIRFGLRGMGVAPAGTERTHSGHHHVLIDTELPPLDQPIPNDPNHLHFGSGQTEAEIELTPGPHTLQLLFADKDHIPHATPLVSEKIRVVASDAPAQPVAQGTARQPSPKGARVYLEYPPNGARVPRTFKVRFGLTNMGVAPAGFEKASTGHHHLIIDSPLPPMGEPIPNEPKYIHFGSGQTESTVTLPPGPHTLQLLLGDHNHIPHDPPVMSKPIKVFVGDVRAKKRKARKAGRK
jgi:hypothetical protein